MMSEIIKTEEMACVFQYRAHEAEYTTELIF